jgi:flagellar biosynthesis protein FlhA
VAEMARSHRGFLGSDLLFSAGILGILFVLLVPLPPPLIDMLLVVNLAASALILLAAACMLRPLEFSVFPSLLLVATLFRLALNIATTRLILGNAAEGPLAAGRVVETFGGFLAGSSPVIGLTIFALIVVVQFVVITRGATRVSEVAARFQLDALPGRQLGIDGDLAAGHIDRETAHARRAELSREADFYGAMDGASKFVRGDAVAGVIITLINLAGGMAVGALQHGMDLAAAASVFSKLTIGDGLVSQIPALMVSVGTALLVTRSAAGSHLGVDMGRQLLSSHGALFAVAAFLIVLLPSGLPPLPLLAGAAACAFCAERLRRERQASPAAGIAALTPALAAPLRPPAAVSDVRSLLPVEPLELEIGYRLLPLVDQERGGDLLRRIGRARESVARELGLVVPPVRVSDSRRLGPCGYSIRLRGSPLGSWKALPCGFLAWPGKPAAMPQELFAGLPAAAALCQGAVWIEEAAAGAAMAAGYELIEPVQAIALHLERAVREHAADLLSREEVARLLEGARQRAPGLVDELVPALLKVSEVQRVLQELLRQGVSIRDLETILEALGDVAPRNPSTSACVEEVRRALARSTLAALLNGEGRLAALLLDPALEEFLRSSLVPDGEETSLIIDPQTAELIRESCERLLAEKAERGGRTVLLSSSALRPHLAKLLQPRLAELALLSYEEVVDDDVLEVRGTLALEVSRRFLGAGQEVRSIP